MCSEGSNTPGWGIPLALQPQVGWESPLARAAPSPHYVKISHDVQACIPSKGSHDRTHCWSQNPASSKCAVPHLGGEALSPGAHHPGGRTLSPGQP
eukprot:15432192-Alexandrium_andersonii.AAC.1